MYGITRGVGCRYCRAGLTRSLNPGGKAYCHFVATNANFVSMVDCTERAPILPDNSYEQAIVNRQSTPGISRNVLTRYAKRLQLEEAKVAPAEIEKILAELYSDA